MKRFSISLCLAATCLGYVRGNSFELDSLSGDITNQCDEPNKNKDYLACEEYYQDDYNACVKSCNVTEEEYSCLSSCSRDYARQLVSCPCQEGCPFGCPCPEFDDSTMWQCPESPPPSLSDAILVVSTSRIPAMLTTSNGGVLDLMLWKEHVDTTIETRCSFIFQGQAYFLGLVSFSSTSFESDKI